MKGGREDEWGEGVVLGLITICRPVLSHHSHGVFIVWACCRALIVVSSSCIVVIVCTSFVVGVSCCGHGGCGVVWSSCGGMVVVFMG